MENQGSSATPAEGRDHLSTQRSSRRLLWRLGAWLLGLMVPPRCALCRQPGPQGFCHGCRELLPWIVTCCERCGTELGEPGICRGCRQRPPTWDRFCVPLRYDEPVSWLLHGLKYQNKIAHANALGWLLAEQVQKASPTLPDALVPIPLHTSRLRSRGFNQAELLANQVGCLLGVPVDNSLLVRRRNTLSQTDLVEQERRKNMKNAFAVSAPGRYDAVALIDDVITSGATMGAACDALHDQGYTRVSVWAVTKT